MTAPRAFNRWRVIPIVVSDRAGAYVWERPTAEALLQMLRTEAEIQDVGRSRFAGSLKARNRLWLDYRSFLRQAISNFRAAVSLEDRSSSLLYYYGMLNFAKAELLAAGQTAVLGPITHGLSFNTSRAKSVGGDGLTVKDGVFRLLYELRAGYSLPVGTRLPVRRLLGHIPEIGSQLEAVKAGNTEVHGLLQLIAVDNTSAWALLAVDRRAELEQSTSTSRLFRRYFEEVEAIDDWRDRFAVSKRWGGVQFFQSMAQFPYVPGDDVSMNSAVLDAARNVRMIRDILGRSTQGMWDGWLSPSLYRSKMIPMPPALARYAIAFYASSLVRYRPSIFDPQVSPDQAYLFDAIARECSIPMLVDTVSAIGQTDYTFIADDALRN